MDFRLLVKRVGNGARVPSYATEGAAGLDLYACLEAPMVLPPASVSLVPTGVAVAIPVGHVGLVRDRSSMARMGIHTVAGVIDSDYRGEILVAVHNASGSAITIEPGDRVAQMLVLACPQIEIEEVPDLPTSGRGAGGFGSTGR